MRETSDKAVLESSLHHCGDPVKHVQAGLLAGKTRQSRFIRRGAGGAVKHAQARLSTMKSRESSFHHCGGPVRVVQACLCA